MLLKRKWHRTAFLCAFIATIDGLHQASRFRTFRHRSAITPLGSTIDAGEGSKAFGDQNGATLADAFIGSLFSIKPLYRIASDKAREMIVKRGGKIGVNWKENVHRLQCEMDTLSANFETLTTQSRDMLGSALQYPDYYLKPFHAYEEGNLSWQAAMEVESAALSVHCQIYTNSPSELDPRGDFLLRDNFHQNMQSLFALAEFKPKRVLDIGCSTGLSTIKLHQTFPDAEIVGIDLSPHMLSVAKLELETLPRLESAKTKVSYMHAAGERTPFSEASGSSSRIAARFNAGDQIDMVTMCLVSHELPRSAARDIFEEAYRILPHGGAIAIMDMDPMSASFQKLANNPFAFAAFKSTEPWIGRYMELDLRSELRQIGFSNISQKANSPRHRTIVAFKM